MYVILGDLERVSTIYLAASILLSSTRAKIILLQMQIYQYFTITVDLNGFGDQSSGFGFSFGSDNGGSLFFFVSLDDELLSFSFLLSDLLHFNGSGEFSTESKMGDGDIIEGQSETLSSLDDLISDILTDLVSVGQDLDGIISGEFGLDDFVDERRQDLFFVVGTNVIYEGRQEFFNRSIQNSD